MRRLRFRLGLLLPLAHGFGQEKFAYLAEAYFLRAPAKPHTSSPDSGIHHGGVKNPCYRIRILAIT
jgi:hypothetical protein